MDISPVESCPLVWCVFVRRGVGERMISACVVPTVKHGGVMVWRCFAGYTVCDLFTIQGTLNQHGYHSSNTPPIWFALSGTIIFSPNRTMTQNPPPGCVRVIWQRRRVMGCCIRWPGLHNHPNWDGLWLVGPQSEGKAANKCSAYVGTPSRLLEKKFLMKLVERIHSCHQGKGWLLWIWPFLVTTWFHMFLSFDV